MFAKRFTVVPCDDDDGVVAFERSVLAADNALVKARYARLERGIDATQRDADQVVFTDEHGLAFNKRCSSLDVIATKRRGAQLRPVVDRHLDAAIVTEEPGICRYTQDAPLELALETVDNRHDDY